MSLIHIVEFRHDPKIPWKKYIIINSGLFSMGAMGALAPAILGQSILSPPISTRNFGTIYYRQHPQFKSLKYAPD